jgi:hypothetical protein
MKTLRSLFALCAFAVLALTTLRADYLELERDYFYTDSTESLQELESSYHVFGSSSGDDYFLTLDYYFGTLDIDSVEFEAWYVDSGETTFVSDIAYGGAIEAGEDFSWLDVGLTLPSGTPGTLTVAVTFFFSDNTHLTEWLSTPVY